jgi:hypothetical protein
VYYSLISELLINAVFGEIIISLWYVELVKIEIRIISSWIWTLSGTLPRSENKESFQTFIDVIGLSHSRSYAYLSITRRSSQNSTG